MADIVSTNQFKNGMHISLDGGVWRIVEFQHVKPGKGGAFVRTKVKNIGSGAVVERTFRAGEKFERIHTEVKEAQYLYDAGDDVVFMDTESYEQFALGDDVLGDTMSYVIPESMVTMDWFEGNPVGVEVPSSVDLKIVDTAPGIKGATASAQKKPATLETGLVVQVPSFINEGEVIRVSTEDGSYLGRGGA